MLTAKYGGDEKGKRGVAVLSSGQAANYIRFAVINRNLDTGRPVTAGEYKLADRAFRKYLEDLGDNDPPEAMRVEILRFYGNKAQPGSSDARRVLTRLRTQAYGRTG